MPKLKSHQIYLKICTLVNIKVLNTNLTGFSFSENLLSILTSSELIKRVLQFFPMTIFGQTHRLTWS